MGWFQQLLADSGGEGTAEPKQPVVPRPGLVIAAQPVHGHRPSAGRGR
jgi:hypothetical protein